MGLKTRGLFIVFEGGEATGKSTQIGLLSRALKRRGFKVLVTREPGGSPLGEELRSLFKHHKMSALTELFILEAARAEHVTQVIAPALQQGMIVISDRYTDSTVVYQAMTRGLNLSLVRKLNEIAVQKTKPQRVYVLDASKGLTRLHRRGGLDRLEREGIAFHKMIRQNYLKLAKKDRRLKIIDADPSREAIHAEIWHDMERYLQKATLC